MNIDSNKISDMNVLHVIYFLSKDDDFLITNTFPHSEIENIRDQLLIQYNKITNSNVMTNAERKNVKKDKLLEIL